MIAGPLPPATGTHRPDRHPAVGTVVFIDMAGFTALTDVHCDNRALDVVEQFKSAVLANLPDPSVLVKFIGEAAMLVFHTSADAVAAVTAILEACEADGFPELRVGLHRGALAWRGDGPYGATVDLASRITGHAAGGQVLATAATVASHATDRAAPVGSFAARGTTDPVQLVEVRTSVTPSAIDPVCHMRVTRGQGVATVVHDDERWELCSLSCARRFTTNPNMYLAQLRQPTPTPLSSGLPPGLIG